MSNDDDLPRCAICPAPSRLVCTGCRAIRFCTQECKETLWLSHEMFCSKYKNFQDAQRPADPECPDTKFYRVAYFPASGTEAEFRWLASHCGKVGDQDGMRELMAGAAASSRPISGKNYYNGREIENPMVIRYDDNFMAKYEQSNFSLHLASNGFADFEWSGPIVVYCGGWPDGGGPRRDIDMQDLNSLSAWLSNYSNSTKKIKERKGPKIHGVKIPCQGERRVTGLSSSKAVKIPRAHGICEYGSISPVSERIGIPLIAVPYGTLRKEWNSITDMNNQAATYMHVGIDPSFEVDWDDLETCKQGAFGFAPKRWMVGKGNVLIARVDRKELDPEFFDAFGDFCQYHLREYFQWASEAESAAEEDESEKVGTFNEVVLEQMTPKVWDTYFSQWLKLKAQKAGVEILDVTDDLIDGVARMGLTAKDGEKLMYRLTGLDEEAFV